MISKEALDNYCRAILKDHPHIDKGLIIKDLYLSMILKRIGQHIEKNKESVFRHLVFKGGTLLVKGYFGYYRFSEDLDFTYSNNPGLAELTRNSRGRAIRDYLGILMPEIEYICNELNLDFKSERANRRYCRNTNRRNTYTFFAYFDETSFIKIEVNFFDTLLPYAPRHLTNIAESIGLKKAEVFLPENLDIAETIHCMSLREIAKEKIRAILTRPRISERDLLDLYMINSQINIFALDGGKIAEKINKCSILVRNLPERIRTNIAVLGSQEFEREADSLILTQDFDKEAYNQFTNRLIDYVVKVGKLQFK